MGEYICWLLANGLMFSRSEGVTGDVTKMLTALGFIFVGAIYRCAEIYKETHIHEK